MIGVSVAAAEQWAPVSGFEGSYEVSSHGRVKSLPRTIIRSNGWKYRVSEKFLKLFTTSSGLHLYVVLSNPNGFDVKEKVHRLVLSAFVGPPPSDHHEGCHNDGDGFNNNVANLRWDTRSGNVRDAVRHGTHNMVRRSVCPLGHSLVPPNLKPYQLTLGRRQCQACAWANNDLCRSGNTFTRSEAADLHYARIMSATSLPISYERLF